MIALPIIPCSTPANLIINGRMKVHTQMYGLWPPGEGYEYFIELHSREQNSQQSPAWHRYPDVVVPLRLFYLNCWLCLSGPSTRHYGVEYSTCSTSTSRYFTLFLWVHATKICASWNNPGAELNALSKAFSCSPGKVWLMVEKSSWDPINDLCAIVDFSADPLLDPSWPEALTLLPKAWGSPD